ncbi:hypothetical protein THAOC_12835, partial [Thalassiosira oceanica]
VGRPDARLVLHDAHRPRRDPAVPDGVPGEHAGGQLVRDRVHPEDEGGRAGVRVGERGGEQEGEEEEGGKVSIGGSPRGSPELF